MPVMTRGFPYYRRGAEAPTQPCVAPHDIPVFSERDGPDQRVFMVREIMNAAYRTPDELIRHPAPAA
jgi:hypothetical protein